MARHKDPELTAMVFGFVAFVFFFGILFISMHVGTAMSLVHQDVPANPIIILIELVKGKIHWPRGATVMLRPAVGDHRSHLVRVDVVSQAHPPRCTRGR